MSETQLNELLRKHGTWADTAKIGAQPVPYAPLLPAPQERTLAEFWRSRYQPKG